MSVVRVEPVPTVVAPAVDAAPPAWRRLLGWWPLAAALLGGALLVGAFAPFDVAGLAWVALVPLVAAVWWVVSYGPGPAPESVGNSPSRLRRWVAHLRRRPGVRAAILGYAFGLVFFWGVFSWLTTVTLGGTIAIGFYFAGYTALWAWFLGRLILGLGLELGTERGARRVVRSRWNLLFSAAGAAAWVAQEWVRGWMFSGWGWNGLGVALHGHLGFVQLAEWTGVAGLSFLLAWANLMAAATVRRFYVEIVRQRENLRGSLVTASASAPRSPFGAVPEPRRGRGMIRPHFDFTLTLAGVFAVFMLGQVRLSQSSTVPRAGETRLRVAAVQAGIPQFRKWDLQFQDEIFDTYRGLTERALAGNPQLLLWPEASTPRGFLNDQENYEFVKGFAEGGAFNFIAGTVLGEPDPLVPNRGREYNAAAIFTPGTEYPSQIYRKVHLVPFGEYVPLRHSFPLFGWIAGDQVPSDFDHGDAPAVFQLENPDVRAAPLICFEDTLGELVRRFVLPQPGGEAGAGLLVNLTNDGWFGHSAASLQQLHEAVFRTVENRRPMVRCANTGVTCFVDRFGRVTQTLRTPAEGTFGAGVLAGEVVVPAPDAPVTFYTRYGEFFAEVCAGVAVAVGLRFLLAPFLRRRQTT